MEDAVELTTFTATGDVYVYAPLPPATSYGHRAELWNPDKWMQEVKLKVVTAADHCFVRMLSKEGGELFAECPLPADGTPLTTVVEAVVDSSRYFVAKVVDRESSKHAFIGIGFRNRMDASDFAAALHDYRQYLRRKQEAAQLRQDFETLRAPSGSGSEAAESTDGAPQDAAGLSAVQKDFSLKPGETLHIKLSPSLKRGDSSKGGAGRIVRSGSAGSSGDSSSSPSGAAVPRLAPPGGTGNSGGSSSGFFRLQPPPAASPSAAAATGSTAAAAGAAQSQQHQACSGSPPAAAQQPAGPGRASLDGGDADPGALNPSAAPAETADDEWGDFVG